MIYSLEGILILKRNGAAVIDVKGVGYKVMMPDNLLDKLPLVGSEVKILTHLQVREDDMSLFGFLEEEELQLFEALISVSGIGPKSAMNVMSIASVDRLSAAISGGEIELLRKVSGIGQKTAERIILELKDKLSSGDVKGTISKMEADDDVYEALTSMGYTTKQAKNALAKIDQELKSTSDRLKEALKIIKS